MRIPIAEEGRSSVIIGLSLTVASLLAGGRRLRSFGLGLAAATAGLAWFFRDPDRVVVPIENGVLSPADGRVIRIEKCELPEFFYGPVRRVSIFMSLCSCHVNRAPVSGQVVHRTSQEGGFVAAWEEEAAEANRRVGLGIAGAFPVFMRQIAGLVARQIVTRPQVGDMIMQGDRVGLIKFGSRVDVYFPLELRLMVNVGDYAFAGVTALAELPPGVKLANSNPVDERR